MKLDQLTLKFQATELYFSQTRLELSGCRDGQNLTPVNLIDWLKLSEFARRQRLRVSLKRTDGRYSDCRVKVNESYKDTLDLIYPIGTTLPYMARLVSLEGFLR